MPTIVFNIVRQEQHAGEILNNLRDNGFANRQISLLCLARIRDTARARGEDFLQDASDWLSDPETLPFPQAGSFLVAGPFLAAAKQIRESDRRLSSLLSSFGLSLEQSDLCTAKLKRGNLILAIHPESHADSLRAATVFESSAPFHCAPLNQGKY